MKTQEEIKWREMCVRNADAAIKRARRQAKVIAMDTIRYAAWAFRQAGMVLHAALCEMALGTKTANETIARFTANESGQGTILLALCLMVIAAVLLAAYCQSGLTVTHNWLP